MSFLDKVLSGASPFVLNRADSAQQTEPFTAPAAADSAYSANSRNNQALQTLARNVAADAGDGQTDSVAIFQQEIAQANERQLSKTADRAVRVVFSKPADEMTYDDYTRDYLRAMLRETGVSSATDDEINRFQALLKDATGDGFGVEDKAEQAKIAERYRAAQEKNGGEATWGTSERGRALVLAGAGAIVRERAATGAALGTAQTVGQEKAMEMARDVPRVLYNAGVGAVESTANAAIDAAASDMGKNPFYVLQANKPHVDLSGAKSEYESELMKRDASGKVTDDANAVTAGKVIEKGVEIGGGFAVGKVLSAPRAPQSLELSEAAQTANAAKTANKTADAAKAADDAATAKAAEATKTTEQVEETSRVYRVQGGTPPRASKHRIAIGEKGEMVVNNKETEALFVTFDDIGRVKVYQAKNRPGSEVISFEVDPKLVQEIRKTAVYEKDVRQFPNAPIIADPTKTSSSFGLPKEWIDKLINASKSGTGRIDK